MQLVVPNLEVGGVMVEDLDLPPLVPDQWVVCEDLLPHQCVHLYPIGDLCLITVSLSPPVYNTPILVCPTMPQHLPYK